jgi:2-polyprenyl-6-hydroxyphenyl methylase/3-demethylubiquinone-9 3-methyltransferase
MGPEVGRERAYDALAERFEVVMNRFDLARRLDLIVERVHDGGGAKPAVLEVGCGLGYLSERIRKERGLAPVSLDIARSLLAIGLERGRVASPVCGSALALPFDDASFDLVLSTECIEHTPDPRGAVHEMLRVLRPGGRVVLTCPNAAWHWAVRLANALGIRPYDGFENWPGFTELRSWVLEAGGEVLEQIGFHAVPFQLPLARRWLPLLDRLLLPRAPGIAVNQLIVARRAGPAASASR